MITLKAYQERVPESLRDFFRLTARTGHPDQAFREVTRRSGSLFRCHKGRCRLECNRKLSGELTEKTSDGQTTEECRCAQFLDGLPSVRFWVRNLSRKSTSFRLQTSKDWFYPDVLCQLTDGRVLVVEYKGKHLYDGNDAEEKRAVGAVWAARSNGRCLFVMPTDGNFSSIEQAIQS